MKMTGEQRIAASRQRVWEALNDPEVLKQCIPGCQSLEKESDDRFKATVAIKIGPIGARFVGAVSLSDLDPPNAYTISGEGQGGAAGFAKGGAKIRLADDAGGTLLSYDVDAQVGGKMAQLGGAVIDATAKQLAGNFFKKFGEIVAPSQKAAAGEDVSTSAAGPTAKAGPSAASPVQPAAASSAPSARAQEMPKSWLLWLIVAALVGFWLGRGSGGGFHHDFMGASTGLLVVIVAAAAFEFGRRAAAPIIMLDGDLLKRISALVSEKKS